MNERTDIEGGQRPREVDPPDPAGGQLPEEVDDVVPEQYVRADSIVVDENRVDVAAERVVTESREEGIRRLDLDLHRVAQRVVLCGVDPDRLEEHG